MADAKIEIFYDGQFSNEVRQTIMTLLTECGVSQKKVNDIMNVVLRNLTGKHLTRLPSAGAKSRLLIEVKRVAQKQIGDAMLTYENDLPDQVDPNTYIGNKVIICIRMLHLNSINTRMKLLNAGCKTQMTQ